MDGKLFCCSPQVPSSPLVLQASSALRPAADCDSPAELHGLPPACPAPRDRPVSTCVGHCRCGWSRASQAEILSVPGHASRCAVAPAMDCAMRAARIASLTDVRRDGDGRVPRRRWRNRRRGRRSRARARSMAANDGCHRTAVRDLHGVPLIGAWAARAVLRVATCRAAFSTGGFCCSTAYHAGGPRLDRTESHALPRWARLAGWLSLPNGCASLRTGSMRRRSSASL